jgi:hypothetical protein
MKQRVIVAASASENSGGASAWRHFAHAGGAQHAPHSARMPRAAAYGMARQKSRRSGHQAAENIGGINNNIAGSYVS